MELIKNLIFIIVVCAIGYLVFKYGYPLFLDFATSY